MPRAIEDTTLRQWETAFGHAPPVDGDVVDLDTTVGYPHTQMARWTEPRPHPLLTRQHL